MNDYDICRDVRGEFYKTGEEFNPNRSEKDIVLGWQDYQTDLDLYYCEVSCERCIIGPTVVVTVGSYIRYSPVESFEDLIHHEQLSTKYALI